MLPALGVAAVVGVIVAAAVVMLRGRRRVITPTERATYQVLHSAALASGPLRQGLRDDTAAAALKHLRTLVGTAGLALADRTGIVAHDGGGADHRDAVLGAARRALATERPVLLHADELSCVRLDCPVRGVVAAPVGARSRTGGPAAALIAVTDARPSPGLLRVVLETANWMALQLELAELQEERARSARAEVRALRAQISPHFVYNALTAIASFVRTDPERARELILEFAEFTRYSFRAHGDFTTLAEELRSIDRYLTIERARFGEKLQVRLRVAPEVLPVEVPFLCLQPLVENAVRHGLHPKPGMGTIRISAADAGADCEIIVEDDGVGMDPAILLHPAPVGDGEPGRHVGLGNVDDRLRAVFGDSYGLVVETAPDAGTRVSLRIPKFHRSSRA
ncbi:sensor histidine kinase [Catellatospora sp. TT07R-123]|uniref:sensor histidine kinase n=1 Tax=Catellatospora sp. TT07R-123 TaxID=2733863 RepID=UPI001B2108FB|nr:histidine kinase [Catellatospora sp. TT07R-123]GHJ48426.1 sensor histidine kinase [Catellatospora sp. TT07R-123]